MTETLFKLYGEIVRTIEKHGWKRIEDSAWWWNLYSEEGEVEFGDALESVFYGAGIDTRKDP